MFWGALRSVVKIALPGVDAEALLARCFDLHRMKTGSLLARLEGNSVLRAHLQLHGGKYRGEIFFATSDVELAASVVGHAPQNSVAIRDEAWGMHGQGEDLNFFALGSSDGVGERMKAAVIVAVGDQN